MCEFLIIGGLYYFVQLIWFFILLEDGDISSKREFWLSFIPLVPSISWVIDKYKKL